MNRVNTPNVRKSEAIDYWVLLPRTKVFPLDMLRYDEAHPLAPGDAALITRLIQQQDIESLPPMVAVHLCSYLPPTEGRWASFGIKISMERPDQLLRRASAA